MSVDVEKAWHFIAMIVVLALAATGIVFICKPKNVRSYYLHIDRMNYGVKSCVWADVDWAPDWQAFCTDDINIAIASVKELNATVKP